MRRVILNESGSWIDRGRGVVVAGRTGTRTGASDSLAADLVAAGIAKYDDCEVIDLPHKPLDLMEPGPEPKAERTSRRSRRKKAKRSE